MHVIHLSSERLFVGNVPVEVLMVDAPLHTDAHPRYLDLSCPCHESVLDAAYPSSLEEGRYTTYALSAVRRLVFDLLTGQMHFEGLSLDIPLTKDETWELTKFCVENRSFIEECCREAEQI